MGCKRSVVQIHSPRSLKPKRAPMVLTPSFRQSRFLFKALLFCTLFWLIGCWCSKQTCGFQVSKILTHEADYPHLGLPQPSSEELKQIQNLLDQPFEFLGRGGQCFAFLGRDQKTVIKFF